MPDPIIITMSVTYRQGDRVRHVMGKDKGQITGHVRRSDCVRYLVSWDDRTESEFSLSEIEPMPKRKNRNKQKGKEQP